MRHYAGVLVLKSEEARTRAAEARELADAQQLQRISSLFIKDGNDEEL